MSSEATSAIAQLPVERVRGEVQSTPSTRQNSSVEVLTHEQLHLLLRRADFLQRKNLFDASDTEKERFTLAEAMEIAGEVGVSRESMEEAVRYTFNTSKFFQKECSCKSISRTIPSL